MALNYTPLQYFGEVRETRRTAIGFENPACPLFGPEVPRQSGQERLTDDVGR